MDGQTDREVDRWMDRHTGLEQGDGHTVGQRWTDDGQRGGQMDGQRWTDGGGQMDGLRWTDRELDRWMV